MLKLLIVDDEPLILEGMKTIIDWNEYGFELIGTANDGENAIPIIKENMPDIIITDIKMKFITGLELISIVREINEEMEFILISAYSNFEYAKQACDMAVFSYVLKPINKEELISVMLSLKEKIEREKSLKKNITNMQALLKDEYPIMINKFLINIFENKLTLEQINKKCKMFNISFDTNSSFTVTIIRVNKPEEVEREFDLQYGISLVNKIIGDVFSKEYEFLTTYINDTSLGILVWKREITEEDKNRIDELLYRVKNTIKRIIKIKVSIARGPVVNKTENIYMSYLQANKVMKHGLILGSDVFLTSEQINGILNTESHFPEKLERSIIEGIKCSDLVMVKKNIDEFVKYFKVGEYTYSSVCFSMHQLYMSVIKELVADEYFSINIDHVLKTVNEFNGKPIDDIAQKVYQQIEEYIIKNSANKRIYVKGIVGKVIENIKINFKNPNLTTKEVAYDIGINASYLGQIFRREMGKTFNEYLSILRIEESKTLLKSSNMKVYEIAENVGYENYPYFNVVFKRIMGITPTEYRDKYYKE